VRSPSSHSERSEPKQRVETSVPLSLPMRSNIRSLNHCRCVGCNGKFHTSCFLQILTHCDFISRQFSKCEFGSGGNEKSRQQPGVARRGTPLSKEEASRDAPRSFPKVHGFLLPTSHPPPCYRFTVQSAQWYPPWRDLTSRPTHSIVPSPVGCLFIFGCQTRFSFPPFFSGRMISFLGMKEYRMSGTTMP
jgi:hypothetical protein